ncbi:MULTISPECIES: carbohydrate ABC transporter permease [Paenibacillus]|jgi:putative aldouronate transport system permease protein|uniref:ABC transporter permease n=1 Tax=Paenibacillus odorifer TaxID=189426 RepID=A0A1R0Y0U9_9BACL|nr:MULTISPECIES: carbohydrate ABC transporter permease [Paenibacillus]AWV33746.1 ABC transporter permease [Paenibacillus odorifer]MDH6427415.1 putative aldouronate transport system permease protein [Paenibacillus sp. PastH-4]MDH6443445.1 putative aldouronate transport system permease protein [Paenibacillus sp. PastF-4]MDH6525851.1 putative aldouronate transport system permease protein [Paenibacillus sp. PastH-3]OMC74564.1 ABC transporter permease [Paenibacillus odorifer]
MKNKGRLFDVFNYIFLMLVGCLMVFPLLHVLAKSFSSTHAINAGEVKLFPVDWTLMNYQVILGDTSIWRAFMVSIFITVVGTLINLILTASLAYPLSRSEYSMRKGVLILILITMIFHAPLIPNYMVIKNLHLIDSLWVLIIPSAISAYNLFIMRSFFSALPTELIDSARMDGAGELRTMWSVILPLSKPVMATMGLFYAVSHWNSYSSALYFINTRALYPLQLRLREIVLSNDLGQAGSLLENVNEVSPAGVQMAVIVVSVIPIIIVYPFLQKYFIKGMLIGSIKS